MPREIFRVLPHSAHPPPIVPQVPRTLLVSAADTADLWLAENDPQGVAFENEVLE
jgi:hypothetical protein